MSEAGGGMYPPHPPPAGFRSFHLVIGVLGTGNRGVGLRVRVKVRVRVWRTLGITGCALMDVNRGWLGAPMGNPEI